MCIERGGQRGETPREPEAGTVVRRAPRGGHL